MFPRIGGAFSFMHPYNTWIWVSKTHPNPRPFNLFVFSFQATCCDQVRGKQKNTAVLEHFCSGCFKVVGQCHDCKWLPRNICRNSFSPIWKLNNLDLHKMLERSKNMFSQKSGLMVIYQDRIRKKSPTKQVQEERTLCFTFLCPSPIGRSTVTHTVPDRS